MSADQGTARATGWPLVIGYAAVAGVSQLLWLTYAPVTDSAAEHYGVSVTAIGWLANVFPLLYVLLAVPAGLALDRSPRSWLASGAVLTAVGGLVRLGGDSFGWALAGQLLVALAQPFVLNAITGVVAALPERARPSGIAVGTAGLFLGMVVALGLGSALGGGHVVALMYIEAVLAVVAVIAFLLAQWSTPASAAEPIGTETGARGLRGVWTDPVLRRIAVLAFLGFGVYIALATWLQPLLEPAGVSESGAGALLTVAVLAGALGSGVLSAMVGARGVEVLALRAALVLAAAGCVVLAVAGGMAVAAVGAVLTVVALLTALPVLLALCERRAGASAGSASALLWLAGNLGGLVVAGVVGVVVHHPLVAFLLLAGVALAAIPAVRGEALAVHGSRRVEVGP
jgi:predicted MFS family arabinose efflux permease